MILPLFPEGLALDVEMMWKSLLVPQMRQKALQWSVASSGPCSRCPYCSLGKEEWK